MNEKLKMKPSPALIICRIVGTVLVVLLVGMAFFGVCDFRTEEQKIADFKEEILTDAYAQAALKGLRGAYRELYKFTPERISVRDESGVLYVAVEGKDSSGEAAGFFYNATTGREISPMTYFGVSNGSLFATATYRNLKLQVLCEEVWK